MVRDAEAFEQSEPALSVKRSVGPLGCAGCIGYLTGLMLSSCALAAGLVLLWMLTLSPALDSLRARSWELTDCVILESRVAGGNLSSVEVTYRYQFSGRTYHGRRYQFLSLSTAGDREKKRIVEHIPAGSHTVCFVNPDQPDESVLNRSMTGEMLWGLLSLPLLAIGLIGYFALLSPRKRPAALEPPADVDVAGRPLWHHSHQAKPVLVSDSDYDLEDLQEEPGPVTLKADSSRIGVFLFLLIFTLIWDGAIGGFMFVRAADWRNGDWEWMPDLMLIPFVLVGLGLLAGLIYVFLGLFNPVPLLTLSRRMIPLGGTADLLWRFEGATQSMKSLTITLKGVEEAQYTRGTDTHTDSETFFEAVLFETADPIEIPQGHVPIAIPGDSMHSLTGQYNKIKWQIVIRGDIPQWPDVHATFPIRVVPHE